MAFAGCSLPAAMSYAQLAPAGPADARAGKVYAKAMKELEDRKYLLALDDLRKADRQDASHCKGCEIQAYNIAKLLEDYKTAREETSLLLGNASTPEEKAEIHVMAGDACLAEGGYRIYEEPFQNADSEFQAALALQPGNSNCLYGDGVALAHLHRYDKARERFEQYVKAVSNGAAQDSPQSRRARLFTAQPELARKRIAPNFHVVASDGSTISMEALAGKVVLIDFWASWCGPCMNALPHLKQIAKQFEGQPLVVVSISLDADETTWKTIVKKNEMTWTQYRDGGFDGPIASQFHVKAIPTTFTIDANGFVQDQQVGDGEIEAKLKKLIEAVSAAQGKTQAEMR